MAELLATPLAETAKHSLLESTIPNVRRICHCCVALKPKNSMGENELKIDAKIELAQL